MESLKTWWNKPYDDNMGVKGWFLFLGLLAVISVLWTLILREISETL